MAYAFNSDKSKAKIVRITEILSLPASGTGNYIISVPASLGLDLTKCHILSFGVNNVGSGNAVNSTRRYNLFPNAVYSLSATGINLSIPVGSYGGTRYQVNFVLMQL